MDRDWAIAQLKNRVFSRRKSSVQCRIDWPVVSAIKQRLKILFRIMNSAEREPKRSKAFNGLVSESII